MQEPNNFDHAGQREHWAGINLGGPTATDFSQFSEWGDTLMRPFNVPGFIVEYSETGGTFALGGTAGGALLSQSFDSWTATPAHWTLTAIGEGSIAPSSDPALARAGDASLRFNSRNIALAQTATLKLDLSRLSAASDLSLEFWARRTGSHIGKLELSFSGDGTTWQSVHRETPDLKYRRYALDLDQTLANLGIAMDSDVYLRFGHLALIQDLHIDSIRIVRGIDVTGPQAQGHTPTTVGSGTGALSQIIVRFDEAIDPASFSTEDVSLTDPLGRSIAVDSVAAMPVTAGGSAPPAFRIGFADQSRRGIYRLFINPAVSDLSGNALNQDGDLLSGESGDGYSGAIDLNADALALTAGGTGNVFAEDFEDWQTVPDRWRFGTISGGTIEVASDAPHGGMSELQFNSMDIDRPQWAALKFDMTAVSGDTDLAFDFWSRWAGGHGALFVDFSGDGATWTGAIRVDHSTEYSRSALDLDATLAAAGITLDADVFIRFRHLGLVQDAFLDDIRITRGIDVLGPSVAGISPTAVSSATASLDLVTVTFDEPMDPSTISAEDFTVLTPWNEPARIVSVSQVGAVATQTGIPSTTSFVVSFATEKLRGIYTVIVASSVTDAAGNPLNQDSDVHMGESEDLFVGILDYSSSALPLTGDPGMSLFSESFEAWPLPGPHWSFGSIAGGMIGVSSLSPKTGSKELQFNPMNTVIPQWATLKLDLSALTGATDIDLEFWARQAVSSHGRVCLDLSGDGAIWTECLLVTPREQYSRFVLDLDQALTDAGITMESDVYIRLSHLGLIQDLFVNDLQIARGLDLQGPSVVTWSPATLPSNSGALSQISVTFNEALDPLTLSATDIQIWDPYGTAVEVVEFAPHTVTTATVTSGTTFVASFAAQTSRGVYRYRVGPDITDASGNLMNQNGDLQTGEPDDAFWGTVDFDESSLALSGDLGTLFTEGFESWPPAGAHWGFSAHSGGSIMLNTNMPNGGELQLLFDSRNTVDPQYAVLKLDLTAVAGANDLSVDFWAKRLVSTIGRFCVDVSSDGMDWVEVFCARSTADFQNYAFDLDKALGDAGIVPDADVYLRFRHFGLIQDFAMDDVRIARVGAAPAMITSVRPIMGGVEVSFTEEPGVSYRVESTSDFVTWNLVESATGAEGAVTLLDTAVVTGARFYRVIVASAPAQAQPAFKAPEVEEELEIEPRFPEKPKGSYRSPNSPLRNQYPKQFSRIP